MDCLYLKDDRSKYILAQEERYYGEIRIVPYDPQTGYMVRGGGVITAEELTALIRDFMESKKEQCPEKVSDCPYNRDGKCHMALLGDGNPHTDCESMLESDHEAVEYEE